MLIIEWLVGNYQFSLMESKAAPHQKVKDPASKLLLHLFLQLNLTDNQLLLLVDNKIDNLYNHKFNKL